MQHRQAQFRYIVRRVTFIRALKSISNPGNRGGELSKGNITEMDDEMRVRKTHRRSLLCSRSNIPERFPACARGEQRALRSYLNYFS